MKPQFKNHHSLPSCLIFKKATVIFSLIFTLSISNHIWAYSYQLTTGGPWYHVEFMSDSNAARSACISTAAKHGYDGEVICGVEYCHGQYTCFEAIGWLDEFKDITRRPAHSYSFHYPRYYLDNMEDHSTCPSVGNPISITNGNKIESVIDARFNGLDIERHYRSVYSGPLPTIGRQWSLFFEITMNENNSKLLVEKFIAENGVPSFPVPTYSTKKGACTHGLPGDLFHYYAGLERRVSASNPDICEIV